MPAIRVLPARGVMKPTLTWLDLTAADRDRMRRVLDLFSEQGTVDELGLGTIRDALSDALFPGTSSIQTRLRYLLFIPWIYKNLQRSGVRSASIQERARSVELALIGPLLAAQDNGGVIGSHARGTLKRLPSAVYWSALVRFGLFGSRQSQSWFHSRFDELVRGPELQRADDPGVVWSERAIWHPRLPDAPGDFPGVVDFALTRDEATFLRDQFASRVAGTLLAWLATAGAAPSADGAFWEEPAVQAAPEQLRGTVELARRFSLHVEGAPLLYNLMLAELREKQPDSSADSDRVDNYRAALAEWAAREDAEAPFSPESLWRFVAVHGSHSQSQRRFVDAWSAVVRRGAAKLADDDTARALVRNREMTLKTTRSRFSNLGRLHDWKEAVGVGRMDFRWFRVRQLLTDLHRLEA